jgi:hypothetical protein
MLFGETVVFIVRIIRNTQIHSVGRMQKFITVKHVVHIVTSELRTLKQETPVQYTL